ncbi:MAG: cation transporter [Candidatus Thermoplasmatota archaeon]|nr:hypothetical protein [Euryarchaeota archaeon]MBU4032585.1 cation transporter [Candidatus Thermoplasmatota archaeon]MBU4070950.1 cation transporter [Candidatus Thermoplasmatota archaeon]MBU4144154.1 cation transporter [Candidatus Thermoplasmatota archaeon]MBU4591750.1 cation transporter [Candidatus Thermoplasmatota archaeon]
MIEIKKSNVILISYFTIIYNIIEGLASIFLGSLVGSISLIGFGLDSFVESLSAVIVLWRFRAHGDVCGEERKNIERKATRLVGLTLFILATYIAYESVRKLLTNESTELSLAGILIPAISIIVMVFLFRVKRRMGTALHSHSLLADSKQTLACVFLSVAVLSGFILNYLFGFWQADPIAGLIIAVLLVREGYKAIKEEELCGC